MKFSVETNILTGADVEISCDGIPKESIGKYIYNSLKARNPNYVLSVDPISKEVLTARRLLEDSIKVTEIFKRFSLKTDDTISIISENSLIYFAPVLAALYMGIAVAPLNPSYLKDEVKHALDTTKPKLVICSPASFNKVEKFKKELPYVKTLLVNDPHNLEKWENINLQYLISTVQLGDNDFQPYEFDHVRQPAFSLQSSGTTGVPKSVLLTHENMRVVFGVFKNEEMIYTTSSDTTVCVLPFFHIFGNLVQLCGLCFGMKLVIMSSFSPETFLKAVQNYKATLLFVVPPLLLFMTKSSLIKEYDLSSVNEIFVGGAPVGAELFMEAGKRFRHALIRILYGMTEVTGPATLGTRCQKKPGSIGVLVPGIMAKVCDTATNSVLGPMQVGELCFKGPMLMKEYLGNTNATKDFIHEDGFCRSGDIGYYDNDCCFYVVDRIKELIKYKGFQVSPVELEAIILGHPGVKDCCIIGIPDMRCGQLPFGFIVPQPGHAITEDNIIDYVADRISLEKRLSGGVGFVESILKNPSGKILRRKMLEIWHDSFCTD